MTKLILIVLLILVSLICLSLVFSIKEVKRRAYVQGTQDCLDSIKNGFTDPNSAAKRLINNYQKRMNDMF